MKTRLDLYRKKMITGTKFDPIFNIFLYINNLILYLKCLVSVNYFIYNGANYNKIK